MSYSYQLKSHPNRSLFDHLCSVAKLSSENMDGAYSKISTSIKKQDLVKTAYIVGACHDIGKGTSFFQRYLRGETTFDPILKSHSTISSLYSLWIILNDQEISQSNKEFLALASSLAIQGHHNSLKRPTTYQLKLDAFDNKGFFGIQMSSFPIEEMERISTNLKLKSFNEFSKIWQDQVFLMKLIRKCLKSIDSFEPFYIINLLYSCLLDADRMDVSSINIKRINLDENAALKYVNKINNNNNNNNKTKNEDSFYSINNQRNKLFLKVDEESNAASLDDRIFTLTASTGLGKTLASINFALKMRKRIARIQGYCPRIIYVAPFISILDQNVKVFEKLFKNPIQNNLLLLHHHLASIEFANIEDEEKKETYSTPQSELLIQGWNSEIISTTFIQFFNSIFGNRTSQLRRFHNMVGSIVILDEIQSIPFEYWDIIHDAFYFLANKFHFTIILMTATQPLIFNYKESKELVSQDLLTVPQRVKFIPHIRYSISITEFCKEIVLIIENNKDKSILIELNTIRTALETFNFLENIPAIDKSQLFFLSSQIIPNHRKPRIDVIKKNLDDGIPIILVSTQVIEAGVDLDFDIAIRDIGPIDSIVQAAGRCNRNGLRKKDDSPFYIYKLVDMNGNEYAKKIYGRISIDIANEIISKDENLTNLISSYYQEVRRRKASTKSESIKKIIKSLDYDEIQKEFNLIANDFKFPLFIEYDKEAELILEAFIRLCEENKPTRAQVIQTRHSMEQYMIGVSQNDLSKIDTEIVSGIYVLRNNVDHFYYEIKGLSIF
jgi:CRISPR-associated endonuclease/helicase Cas3